MDSGAIHPDLADSPASPSTDVRHMPDPVTLDDLETPAAVVDVPRMHDNLRRVGEYCHAHGLGCLPALRRAVAVAG